MKSIKPRNFLAIILFITLILPPTLSAQTNNEFFTQAIGGKHVISLTMGNLIKGLFYINNSTFTQLMGRYGYSHMGDGTYIANNKSSGQYTIQKEVGEVTMLWAMDGTFANELRDQLSSVAFTYGNSGEKVFPINDKDLGKYVVCLKDKGTEGFVYIRKVY